MNEETPVNNEESKNNVKVNQNDGSILDPDSPLKRQEIKGSAGSIEELTNAF